jgi:hypothetical protein
MKKRCSLESCGSSVRLSSKWAIGGTNITVFPCRMKELDEVLGDLHQVEETDGGCLALIGKILVLLPPEMAGKLQGLIGKRIGVLRLDGYHLRCMTSAR